MNTAFEIYKDFIPDFQSFKDSLYQPLFPEFRINALRADLDKIRQILKEEGVEPLPLIEGLVYRTTPHMKIGNLLSYKLGYIYPQALTSVVAGLILSPKRDSFVLDLCAAPGSKTTLMAQLMNNTGLIVANELFKDRLPALGQNILRLGVTNTIITSYQAQEFPRTHQFDYVMADVPCSGEGNFRIGPKVREHRVWNLERLITNQRRIIIRAYELLKPNGTMLYSTCTYNPFENEGVVTYLLENSDAELIPFDPPIPSEPGLTGWLSKSFHPNLSMARRFYPHHTGSVGFFVAYIRKPGKRADY